MATQTTDAAQADMLLEIRDEVRRIRDEFNEQRKEWFAFQKQARRPLHGS